MVAETSAAWFAGRRVEDAAAALAHASWIDGIADGVAALRGAGSYIALATVTWSFAAEAVACRYGFDAWSGTEMDHDGGVLAGSVRRNFDAGDNAAFVETVCAERGVSPAAAAAVGDSRSDIPTFEVVGFSVALNGDPAARAAATTALDTDDLGDVLPLLVG